MKLSTEHGGWRVCGSCRGPVCLWTGALAGAPDPTVLPNYVRLCCLTCRESSEPVAIDDLPIDQRVHVAIQAATSVCKCGHVKELHYLFEPSPCAVPFCVSCAEYSGIDRGLPSRPALRLIRGGLT